MLFLKSTACSVVDANGLRHFVPITKTCFSGLPVPNTYFTNRLLHLSGPGQVKGGSFTFRLKGQTHRCLFQKKRHCDAV